MFAHIAYYMTVIVFEQTHWNWQQKHYSVMYNICTCSAPVPGGPGCAEGSVSLWEQWKSPYHCNGSQVANELSNYVSISGRFKVKLHWRIFFQYFPEAVFLDTIPSCFVDTESGEHPWFVVTFFSIHTCSNPLCFVTNLQTTCMKPVYFLWLSAPSDSWSLDDFHRSS